MTAIPFTNGSLIHYCTIILCHDLSREESGGQKGVRKTEMMAEKWGCNKIRKSALSLLPYLKSILAPDPGVGERETNVEHGSNY